MKYLVGDLEHKLASLAEFETALETMPISENMDSIMVLIYEKAYTEFYKNIAL